MFWTATCNRVGVFACAILHAFKYIHHRAVNIISGRHYNVYARTIQGDRLRRTIPSDRFDRRDTETRVLGEIRAVIEKE